MKSFFSKIKYAFPLWLILFGVVSATVFYSNQVGSSPSNGAVLQSNGSTSAWVATSTLGITGGLTSYDAFTHPIAGVSATSSQMRSAGFISTASSTVLGGLNTDSLAVGTGGITLQNGYFTLIPNNNFNNGQLSTTHPLAQVGDGRYEYIVDLPTKEVFSYNISDLQGAGLSKVGQSASLADLANTTDMASQGNFLAIVSSTTLYVYDKTKPAVPVLKTSITTNITGATQVFWQGTNLFVVNGYQNTVASFVTNANMTVITAYQSIVAVPTISTISPTRCALQGTNIICANIYFSAGAGDNVASINRLNVQNPAAMTLTSTIDQTNLSVGPSYSAAQITGSYATNQYLYTLDGTNGLIAWNIGGNKAGSFAFISSTNSYTDKNGSHTLTSTGPLVIRDNVAYVGDLGNQRVPMFNIQYPENGIPWITTQNIGFPPVFLNNTNNMTICSGISSGTTYNFYAFQMNSIHTSDVESGNVTTETSEVWKDSYVGNNMSVQGGLQVGNSALISGNLAIVGTTTTIGFVGIGTTTPVAGLDVYSSFSSSTPLLLESAAATGGCEIIKDVGGTNTYTQLYTAGGILFTKAHTGALNLCN